MYSHNDSCKLMNRKIQSLFFPFETTPDKQYFLIPSSTEGIVLIPVIPSKISKGHTEGIWLVVGRQA